MMDKDKQCGAALLEFLVVVPILLTLAFTAIEFGAVFTRMNTITKSVEDAARYLAAEATNKTPSVQQKNIASNLIKYGSVVSTNPPILPGTFNAPVIQNVGAGLDHVSVSIVYPHTPVMGQALNNLLLLVGGNGINLSINLKAVSVMRYVQP